jgi:membrane fusion protein (multidrug efflux system)
MDKKIAVEDNNTGTGQQLPVVEGQADGNTNNVESRIETDESTKRTDKVKRVNKILSFAVPILILLLALGLWYLFTFNWNGWEASKTNQTTDDATIEADIIPLSTRAIGTIETVNIHDFQSVKEGEVLVTLISNDAQASVDQAQAGINSAQEALNNIQIQKQQQEDRIRQAQIGVDVAQTDINTAQIGLSNVQNDIASARIGIETADDDVNTAEAGIEGISADVERTTQERSRQDGLFKAQATTKQRLEAAVADNDRALAGLKARKLDKEKAQALVRTRQQDLSKALNLERVRGQDLRKAQSQFNARRNDFTITLKQLEVLNGQERQLQEDLKAKQANLTIANTNFDYTKILAPRDGVVGEVKVRPGQQLGPGAQVASLVSAEKWVIANYKETQIANMKEGDSVEVVIDAFPGTVIKGRVARVAPASGSEFSALPPENASGSYTRITQRVPVKIVFESNQPVTEKLRPGMSATANVKVGISRKQN